MSDPILPPLKPIPMKERVSVLFVEKGHLDVLDGAFVLVDKNGVRMYAAGQPGGARADRLLYQAKLALDDTARLKVDNRIWF